MISSLLREQGKFGDSLRSKSNVGQINEALCKILCHNICVSVRMIHELGVEPAFSGTWMLRY